MPASDITLSDGNNDEEDDLFILKGNQLYIKAGAPEEGKTKFDFESNPSFDLTISGGGQTQTLKVNITDKILNEDEEITLSLAKRARDDDDAFAPIQITDKNHKVDELDDDYYFLIVSAENANNADLKSKFELTKTMDSGNVTARHLKLKTGQTLEDEATGDITIYVAANKFEIQLEADELQDTQIKSVAKTTEGTFPKFTLTNPLETSPLEVEVGTDEYIVLKDDGTFEAVTQSDLDKLSAGSFAIVATLHTDISDIEDEGLIDTQQKTESDADYFTSTTELKKIDIELTDVALNLTVTKEMDESATIKGENDILGHEKHEDDHVSYQEAEAADTRIVDLDGDMSTTSDQIKDIDGVIIDLSASAKDTADDEYATKTTEDGNDVITLGANAGDLAAGDKLTSIENITGSGFVDVLIGDGSANTLNGEAGDDYLDGGTGDDTLEGGAGDDTLDGGTGADRLTGGAGDDMFVLELSDGARGQDIVTDFTASSDKIQISLTQANITTINGEENDAGKLAKLLELANLSTANNADAGHTSASNDASANDTVITYTAGGVSDVVMVLEDYSPALTFDDFALEVI
ncbi:calcium-binding protein [Alphaproteobacteria bacterium]|nr:calcium-binding protein [Alphaproteobacteria bacterium]